MPIYDFTCGSCGETFEELVRNPDDRPLCPVCGGETDKQLSPFSIRFRSPGFHDYDNKKQK